MAAVGVEGQQHGLFAAAKDFRDKQVVELNRNKGERRRELLGEIERLPAPNQTASQADDFLENHPAVL